ncbi:MULTISPECIES: hypothetical protein [Providencia]|uniref:hypothetical protein n=1 Tax=Providencia TaxID=586 RepID=UPI00140C65B8|nr:MULTISPECIES: hypothetical protein [Providencia]MCG9535807.1 hypothetical protein [Providencia huaxiensis]
MRIKTPQQNTNIQNVNRNTSNSSKGISGHTNNVSNNNQKCPVTTSEKTVNKKDVKQLNNAITKLLSDITSKINDFKNNKENGAFSKDNIKDFGDRLDTIQKDIFKYQKLLNSSSYKHHSSKQKTLDRAPGQVKNVEAQIAKLKKQDNVRMNQTHQTYIDNNEKHDNLLMGKKTLSKFEL